MWYPSTSFSTHPLAYKTEVSLYHYLPAYLFDTAARICGQRPFLVQTFLFNVVFEETGCCRNESVSYLVHQHYLYSPSFLRYVCTTRPTERCSVSIFTWCDNGTLLAKIQFNFSERCRWKINASSTLMYASLKGQIKLFVAPILIIFWVNRSVTSIGNRISKHIF